MFKKSLDTILSNLTQIQDDLRKYSDDKTAEITRIAKKQDELEIEKTVAENELRRAATVYQNVSTLLGE